MKEKNVKKSGNVRFAVIDDNGEVLSTQLTLQKAVDWINASYDADESTEFVILEVVAVYELKASKVDYTEIPLSDYAW